MFIKILLGYYMIVVQYVRNDNNDKFNNFLIKKQVSLMT
jgi:hypothetical protein